MKVACVIGTRPEAVKFAPIIHELGRRPGMTAVVYAAAQHRQMLDDVLTWFGIDPNIDLDLMRPRQSLPEFAGRALVAIERVLDSDRPDVVLVQGDTTTALMGALAAHYQKIPVGHVEAGLRTSHRYNPFPEEMNRRLIADLSTLHFTPTIAAANRLLQEGVSEAAVHVTGNTVVDALEWTLERLRGFATDPHATQNRQVLVTAHRRENQGPPLRSICVAIRRLVDAFPDVEVCFPVHLNPAVRELVFGELEGCGRVHLLEPQRYEAFVRLLSLSSIVLTDSGGVQEEAPILGKPVLVLRDTTERNEGIDLGVAKLVGTDSDRIFDEASRLLGDPLAYSQMSRAASPYGDGQAAKKIVDVLLHQTKENSPCVS